MTVYPTNTTTLADGINAMVIIPRIIDYCIDAQVLAPACRQANIAGMNTATASFPLWIKDTAAAIAESGTQDAVALDLSDVDVTAAKAGIVRQVTVEAYAVNILGPNGLNEFIAQDGGRLIADLIEYDLFHLFTSITASVSHTTSQMSVAYFLEAMGKMRVAKAAGGWSVFLGAMQMTHLSSSVASSAGAAFGTGVQDMLRESVGGYAGTLFNVPVFYSNNVEVSASTEIGAIVTDARVNEVQAPIALVNLWAPTVNSTFNTSEVANDIVIHAAYGVGLVNTACATKIVTISS